MAIICKTMRIPKRYGESRNSTCPFCTRIATQKNEQGVEVCFQHTKERLEEIKCICGSWLEQLSGKFGPYFNCLKCGNINFKKGWEMKEAQGNKARAVTIEVDKQVPRKNDQEQHETTITTDDVEYFD